MSGAVAVAVNEAVVTRVLVVDDHATFADLLALALSNEADMECVGSAHSVAEALLRVEQSSPDIVLMDVRLGDEDGIAATAVLALRHPDLRVVVLTAHADSDLMHRAAQAGACCLLSKNGSLAEMLQAMRSARRGGLVVHPNLLRACLTPREVTAAHPSLTEREDQVLRLLAEGRDARGIARQLLISLNTCRGYIKAILAKMGAHSQLEAVAIARKEGLLDKRGGTAVDPRASHQGD